MFEDDDEILPPTKFMELAGFVSILLLLILGAVILAGCQPYPDGM